MGFGTYGFNNTIPSVIAQGDGNMTGMTNVTETEHAYNKSANVVRDSVIGS